MVMKDVEIKLKYALSNKTVSDARLIQQTRHISVHTWFCLFVPLKNVSESLPNSPEISKSIVHS